MQALDILIWFLIGVQVGCLITSVVKKVNPWEILWGFSIWGWIPVIFLNMIK